LAMGVFVAWLTAHAGWAAQQAILAVTLLAAIVAVIAWRAAAPRIALLVWDGQCWRVDDGVTSQLLVMMDLHSCILLRVMPAPRGLARWLLVSASAAGPAWHGLRAALYATPSADGAAAAKAAHHV
jgi:hypothetical protein